MNPVLNILAWLGVFWGGIITLAFLGLVYGVGGMVLQEWLHRRRRAKAQAGKERT